MGKFKDLTGLTFGRLTVIGRSSLIATSGAIVWNCLCSCGKGILVRSDSLNNGHTQSCGCYNKEQSRNKNMIDLTGKIFNRLTILGLSNKRNKAGLYWICKCSCGNIKHINGNSMIQGSIKSCGCLHKEVAKITVVKRNNEYRQLYNLNEPIEVVKARQRHKKWISAILKRDNHTCVLCGSISSLQVHHIIPLCKEIIESRDNLITLCEKCHIEKAHLNKCTSEINPNTQISLVAYISKQK